MEYRLWHLVGLVLMGILSTQAYPERAMTVIAEEGKTFTINCSTTKDAVSVDLYKRVQSEKNVLYFGNPANCKPANGYVGRVKTEGEVDNLSVTITNVTDDDSGLYWCSYNIIQGEDLTKFTSNYTVVGVNADLKPRPPAEPVPTTPCHLWVFISICATVLLFVFICLGLKMKKFCDKKKRKTGL